MSGNFFFYILQLKLMKLTLINLYTAGKAITTFIYLPYTEEGKAVITPNGVSTLFEKFHNHSLQRGDTISF